MKENYIKISVGIAPGLMFGKIKRVYIYIYYGSKLLEIDS